MKKIRLIVIYLRYLIIAKTRHGIHSPFVYKFLDEVLYDKSEHPEFSIVENEVKRLKNDHKVIETIDFGPGSPHGSFTIRTRRISEIAAKAGISEKHGRLLFRIVKHFKPAIMIEMGTSLGISTMYQAMGNREAEFTGLEGCDRIAAFARENLNNAGCRHVNLITGPFAKSLPAVLSEPTTVINYAFIDGDHTYEGTMNYFRQILEHINPESILIFHDIYWSEEMEKAWREIKFHPAVTLTLDLFYMGVVFFRKELRKQNFTIRY